MEKLKPTADCIVARLVPSWGSRVSLLFKATEPYEHYYDENGDEVPCEAIVSWTDVELPPESEDERIRKEIIHYILYKADGVSEEQEHSWIAYLEKQKEQKPAEWSEDYGEEDLRTRFAFYTYKDEDGVLYLSNVFVEETSRNKGFGTKILAAAEKVAETIGAITIRLKVKQDSPANAWYRKRGYGYMAFEDGYDWLEKNLEYMKPNKQEWSEEDEEYLNFFIDIAESLIDDEDYGDMTYEEHKEFYQKRISWLKSLRPQSKQDVSSSLSDKGIICLKRTLDFLREEHNRYGGKDFTNEIAVLEYLITHPKLVYSPQPHWKPSKEQMDALNEIINTLAASKHPHESDYLFNILNGLKKNLQKLL